MSLRCFRLVWFWMCVFCAAGGPSPALAADAPAVAETEPAGSAVGDQASYDQLIYASGATNGAAALCGAAAPDVSEHRGAAARNLRQFAREYHFSADRFDTLFENGQANGRTMMTEMRQSGVDGCTGVLQSFQVERAITYEAMKKAIAEVADGLPEK